MILRAFAAILRFVVTISYVVIFACIHVIGGLVIKLWRLRP